MIRVFIADDHDIVRTGLQQFLSTRPDIEICGEAETAEELMSQAGQATWDVLILDVNMPGSPGPKTVKELLRIHPSLAVIVFTMYPEDSHAVPYLRSGAMGFLNKRRPIRELAEAVRVVAQGKRYITPDLARYMVECNIDLNMKPERMFSGREMQVIRHLARGRNSKETASLLGINQATVNTFVHRIKLKLGVRTIVEVVEFARLNDLLG